jgi:hypothetical protein
VDGFPGIKQVAWFPLCRRFAFPRVPLEKPKGTHATGKRVLVILLFVTYFCFFPPRYLVSSSKSEMEFQKRVCFFCASFIKQQQKNAIAGVTIQNSGVRELHKKKYPMSFC